MLVSLSRRSSPAILKSVLQPGRREEKGDTTTAAEINNPLWGVLGLARHHQRPSAPAALGPKKPTSGEFVYAPVQFPPPMRSLHGVVKASKTEKRDRV